MSDELRLRIVCTGKGKHKRKVLLTLTAPRRPGRPDLSAFMDHDQRVRNPGVVTTFTGSSIEDLICPTCRRRQQWTVDRLRSVNEALADAPGVAEWDVSTGRLARLT